MRECHDYILYRVSGIGQTQKGRSKRKFEQSFREGVLCTENKFLKTLLFTSYFSITYGVVQVNNNYSNTP